MSEYHKRSKQTVTKRPLVLVAVMLAMFMAAIEATIVSTAMPAIVADLGGFSLYSWVFSAYLLMNAVTVMIYGKLSDLFGRKPILMLGIMIFLVGSILCGFARSMEMLIFYRFIQGVGAGAVMPIASTIIGDIYTKEERAKIQGYLSSVWGVSAVLGPVIGGLLVQYVSWNFIFWINIPLGILAIIGLKRYFHENIEKKRHSIDYIGATLLLISVSTIMIVLVEGGVQWSWFSGPILTLLTVFIISLSLFIWQENRTPEPIMPLEIWKDRSILVANSTSLTTGIMLISISSFLPAFVQGVMERSPTVAGFTLTTISIGWPISATIAGRILLKIGFRATAIIGGIALILGSVIFVTLSPNDGPLWAACGSFMFGVGMGFSTTAFIVSIQTTVNWEKRGIATATNMFMRNIGSSVGVALLGGILNSRLQSYFNTSGLDPSEVNIDAVNMLLDEHQRLEVPASVRAVMQEGLTVSLHTVYIVVLCFGVISFFLVMFMPKSEKTE